MGINHRYARITSKYILSHIECDNEELFRNKGMTLETYILWQLDFKLEFHQTKRESTDLRIFNG